MSVAYPEMDALAEELTSRALVCTLDCPFASTIALNELPKGSIAVIAAYRDTNSVLCRRLFDLGFHPGLEVELVRKAPMRDPLVFRVADCEIVLRKRDAARILVHVGEEDVPEALEKKAA